MSLSCISNPSDSTSVDSGPTMGDTCSSTCTVGRAGEAAAGTPAAVAAPAGAAPVGPPHNSAGRIRVSVLDSAGASRTATSPRSTMIRAAVDAARVT